MQPTSVSPLSPLLVDNSLRRRALCCVRSAKSKTSLSSLQPLRVCAQSLAVTIYPLGPQVLSSDDQRSSSHPDKAQSWHHTLTSRPNQPPPLMS
jgi:hypothetical protein